MNNELKPLDPKQVGQANFEPTLISTGPANRDSFSSVGLSGDEPSSVDSIAYASDGLRSIEASRASAIGLLYAIICVSCLGWLPFLKTAAFPFRITFGVVLALMCVMSLYVWRRAKNVDHYTVSLFRGYGFVAVACSITALWFLGPFSPTALAITLGIGFFGQGGDRRGALWICCAAIAMCFVLMLGVTSGVLIDIGLFRGEEAELGGRLFMTMMVPLILAVTLVQARWSRGAMETAMSVAVESAMNVRLKNVQLQEAEAELRRIFGAQGLAGQFTGHTIYDFKLGPLLGRGASGEVYDAVEQTTKKRYALKLLLGQDANEPSMIARFKREGEISMEIESKHVARVSRVGTSETGILFIVMERLEGEDLARILRERGRLPVDEAFDMIRHVCRGLSKAHQKGVVHRDIKPHNLFLHRTGERKGIWKVLDFGISKWVQGNSTITKMGGVVGTPRYMSPEQARGENVDHRSDIYSVGAVLYRCLTGLPPYTIGGLGAISAVAFRRPVRPRQIVPSLSRQVEAILSIAMAPNPNERFQTPDEMVRAFQDALEGKLERRLWTLARGIAWDESGNPR